MATLVLYVGDDGDDEPDHLDWPAPGATLLLAGDTVLQSDGRHVLRPQSGEATSCRGDKEAQERQEEVGAGLHYFLCDDGREVGTILSSDWVM